MRRSTGFALAGVLTAAVHAEHPLAPSVAPRTAIEASKGAWSTGLYRNLFAERGHSSAQIDAKIDDAFQQIFFGDSATQSVYRVQSDTSLALIESAGYTTSPDMGAAMLIAVMMDRPEVFRKLWKFAKTRLQNDSGEMQGYFAHMVEAIPPYTAIDLVPSPDGDETIATALFLASKRWSKSSSSGDYQQGADSILHSLVRGNRSAWMLPLVDSTHKQVVFNPGQVSDPYTDPSYHMPAYYRLWAADADTNAALWNQMADSSYAFLKRAEHPATGLYPEYATFAGAPKLAKILVQVKDTTLWYSDTTSALDARRVATNIAVDWIWFQGDDWAKSHSRKLLDFFAKQTGAPMGEYTLSGKAIQAQGATGLMACNAVAALATDPGADGDFVEALWNAKFSTGDDRYLDGLTQMLSLLQVSGKFIAYGAPGGVIGVQEGFRLRKSFSIRQSGQRLQVEGVEGAVRLLDARGRESTRAHSTGSVTLVAPGPGLWIVDAGSNGTRKVLVAP